MKEEYLTRQSDLIPEEILGKTITVVGAGAIGSFTVLALAKMGFKRINVYDDDMIEDENMNCQFYPISTIGFPKVIALQDMIQNFCGVKINAHLEKVEEGKMIGTDYLICAVDNMEVRKYLFEYFAGGVLIDPRMSAEYATIETIKNSDSDRRLESYMKTLYSDDEAVQERCTAKSTIYTVMLIAGQIAKIVKDTALSSPYARTIDWDIANNTIHSWDSEGRKL